MEGFLNILLLVGGGTCSRGRRKYHDNEIGNEDKDGNYCGGGVEMTKNMAITMTARMETTHN